jgi:hypothetical protein
VLSVHLACPLARFRTRHLFDSLSERQGWSGNVQLRAAALSDLKWWANFGETDAERALWIPPTTQVLHTDAADEDWGAWLNLSTPARGFFNARDRKEHITLKELMAVRMAVQSFGEQIQGQHVLHWEDNQAVVHIIRNLVSKAPAMMRELRLLQEVMAKYDVHLQSAYIRSADNPADGLTRWTDRSDWKLNPKLYELAAARWGRRPTIDRFATANNAQCEKFCSEHLCPGSSGCAWTMEWADEPLNWINPPWKMIARVLRTLRLSGAEAYLVVPDWPTQDWWPDLLELATDVVTINASPDNYMPGASGLAEPNKNQYWNALICKIGGAAEVPSSCVA